MTKIHTFHIVSIGAVVAAAAPTLQPAFAADACWVPPIHAAPEKKFDLRSILKVKEVNALPPILGPLRDHWVAAYQSGSPQTEDVRVVAYAPEAQAIVAYTGCPTDKDGKGYPKEPYPA